MSTVLLDTTIVSLLHPKKRNSSLGTRYQKDIQGSVLALSFQSVAELWCWSEENNWGLREQEGLARFIQRFLVLPYEAELARIWAKVSVHCKSIGRRLESGDVWIAATAVRYGIPLLTHDKDFVGLGVSGLRVISYA